jgi:hypothetical protein
MQFLRFFAVTVATGMMMSMIASPSHAQRNTAGTQSTNALQQQQRANVKLVKPAKPQPGPTVRDHRRTANTDPNVRDHRGGKTPAVRGNRGSKCVKIRGVDGCHGGLPLVAAGAAEGVKTIGSATKNFLTGNDPNKRDHRKNR